MTQRYAKALTPEELAGLSDVVIDTSDIAELGPEFWANARVTPPRTESNVSLRLSEEVLAFFKEQSPAGYADRMAAVLTAYVKVQQQK